MHDYLRTVMVAPMTSGSRTAPFRIPVSFARKNGLILLDQLRTHHQVVIEKTAGVLLVITNAADNCGQMNDGLWPYVRY